MSEKEVKVDQSLMDDGSYLEEEPKNNKILFIVLGLVVTALAVAGGVMMFSGGDDEPIVVDIPTTPSMTLTENQTQTEELEPIELTIETEPELEPEPEMDRDFEFEEQSKLDAEILTLVSQMEIESETQAEKRVELMEQAGYEIDEETETITAPNGNTIASDGSITNTEGVVITDNSMETNVDGTYSVVFQGVAYDVTQAQYEQATSGRLVQSVDGIPTQVFTQIKNDGVTAGGDNLTTEEFIAQGKDTSLDSKTTVTWS